jgi:bifunctional DNA-binding transcriptional regulator/antitoxin component of YhaV-PrlF toxin-antitoxin module
VIGKPSRRKSYRAEDGHWVLWVDKRGRLTLPKALLRERGWEVGDTLQFDCVEHDDGRKALRVSNPDAEARLAPADKSTIAFNAVTAMADALELSLEERCTLLDVHSETYLGWVEHRIDHPMALSVRQRIGALLGIYHLAGDGISRRWRPQGMAPERASLVRGPTATGPDVEQ